MTKWMLAAGAAALAISSPLVAQKGGHEKGQGGGHAAKAERGGGGQKADRGGGQAMKADRGGGREMRAQRVENRADRPQMARVENKGSRGNAKVEVGNRGKSEIRINRGNDDNRGLRVARIDRDDGVRFVPRWNDRGLIRGFVDGCPPGLAKKGNGCMPPGQAKKLVGTVLPAALAGQLLSGPYRDWYRDNDDFYYRNDGDYIYRVRRDGGLIDALFPSYDRDYYYYPVGMQYPLDYNYYNVPYQYSSFYPDSRDSWYRYGDGAIYQVNPSTGLIQGIAALLAGDLSVGQPLPPAYGAYNLPLSYRDRYYDTPNDWYRYNDGYIYRVDPTTQLVTAVINAIV